MSCFNRNCKINIYLGLIFFLLRWKEREETHRARKETGQGEHYRSFCLWVYVMTHIFPKGRLNLCKFFWVRFSAMPFVFRLLGQSTHPARHVSLKAIETSVEAAWPQTLLESIELSVISRVSKDAGTYPTTQFWEEGLRDVSVMKTILPGTASQKNCERAS